MTPGTTQQQLVRTIETHRAALVGLGRYLHAHPELGLEEHCACDRLCSYLKEHGFTVERPYSGLATAFRAWLTSAPAAGPTVAVLAEYDALPELGHACGHNLIAVAAMAAATAMAACSESGSGRFEVIGTPGEELFAGKAQMAAAGAFDHLDACLMVHPGTANRVTPPTNGMRAFEAVFRGRSAHAAASPEAGINALDAAILFFNHVNALRQGLPPDGRLHGIITDGGRAANVIPERAAVEMCIRCRDEDRLQSLCQEVATACHAAARAVGATVSINWHANAYRPFRVNAPLEDVVRSSFGALELALGEEPDAIRFASLDMGNVSWRVPASHPFVAVVPHTSAPVSLHSLRFAELADSDFAYEQMLLAGAAMALTACRLFADPAIVDRARAACLP